MEEMNANPLLMQEDYLKQYKDNIENLKNNPELVSFDKLCYELFEANETGKKFLEYVEDHFLLPSLAKLGSPTYQIDVLWAEGFKDAYRKIFYSIRSQKQRISAEMNK